MGRKNVVKSYSMFKAADISGTVTSETVNVINLDKASIHVTWSGTAPEGTITVQARNGDNDPWYDLDFGSTIPVTGNSGSHQILFLELPFTDIQMIYTSTSGTGTMDARISAKVLGA